MNKLDRERQVAHRPEPSTFARAQLEEILDAVGGDPADSWEMKLIIEQFMNAWTNRSGGNSHVLTLFQMLGAINELIVKEDERIRRMQVDVDWFTVAERLKPSFQGPIQVLEAWEELSDRPEPPHETSAYF